MSTAMQLVGSKPHRAVRPVSLAVRNYLREHRPQGLVLAVSGGADSLAMAAVALDLAERLHIPTLTVTVDHGLRPESASESAEVAELLKNLGADQSVVAARQVHRAGLGPEGDARKMRYGELFSAAQRFARERKLSRVELLLGHTLDDQAETVLLRLARGASSASIGAMKTRQPFPQHWQPTGFDHPVLFLGRPLMEIRRTQTVACCKALRLPAVQDPTNLADGPWRSADGGPLRRSAVRQWVLPLLSRVLAQDVAPALARVASQLQEDEEALDVWVRRASGQATEALPPGALCKTGVLAGEPASIRKRVLRQLVLGRGIPGGQLSARHLQALDDLVTNWHGQGPVHLPGGTVVERKQGALFANRLN